MLKGVVFAAIIAAAVALPAVPGDAAKINQISLLNSTNRCAWITLYGNSGLGMRIVSSGWLHPRQDSFLRLPDMAARAEVKAEMMPGGTCGEKAVDHTPTYVTNVPKDRLKVIQNGSRFQIVRI